MNFIGKEIETKQGVHNLNAMVYLLEKGTWGPKDITGGTETTDGSYQIHTFLANTTVIVSGTVAIDYVLVGGGGGGGGSSGYYVPGAGGGGGVLVGSTTVGAGSYNIVVGDGGAAGTTSTNNSPTYTGQDSTAFGLTAKGGGGGAGAGQIGSDGGSGGGGSHGNKGGLGTTNQGFSGYQTNTSYTYGYGGGGAGGIPTGRNGGVGKAVTIRGTTEYFGGGGGGAGYNSGSGTGTHGGGNGSYSSGNVFCDFFFKMRIPVCRRHPIFCYTRAFLKEGNNGR